MSLEVTVGDRLDKDKVGDDGLLQEKASPSAADDVDASKSMADVVALSPDAAARFGLRRQISAADGDGIAKFEIGNLRDVLAVHAAGLPVLPMCEAILDGDYDRAWSAFDNATVPGAVTDVQVVLIDSGESAPADFEVLRSISGQDGDINKRSGSGRVIQLCAIRRASVPPLTALVVVYDDHQQEPPMGFVKIEQTVEGRNADLSQGAGSQRMFLCSSRGTGPPICELALLFESRKEAVPPGFHRLAKTPEDDPADLCSLCKAGSEVYLCFRLDVRPLVLQFRTGLDQRWASTAALLCACLFSPKEEVVVQALKALHEFVLLANGLNVTLGGPLLNRVFHAICDSQVIGRSHFSRAIQALNVQVLLDAFIRYVYDLDIETVLRVYETFFFERHKDRRECASLQIADFLFVQTDDCAAGTTPATSRTDPAASPSNDAAGASERPRRLSLTIEVRDEGDLIRTWIRNDLLVGLGETVALHKTTQRDVNEFQRLRDINAAFRARTGRLLVRLMPGQNAHIQRLIVGLLLTACKVASYPTSFRLSAKSESIMRKIHALTLILRIVSHPSAVSLFTSRSPLLILRRFVCVSLLESCVTVVPAIFKLVLALFSELWGRYRHLLKTELGVIMDAVLLGMIQSPNCWPEQKIDLIEAIASIFSSAESQIELFYNYDNDILRRNLFGGLVRSLCELSEGKLSRGAAAYRTVRSPATSPAQQQQHQHPIHAAFLMSANEGNASQINLQRTALTTVVAFLESLAQFVSPPNITLNEISNGNLSRSSSIISPHMLETLMSLSPKGIAKQSSFGELFSAATPVSASSSSVSPMAVLDTEETPLPAQAPHKRAQSLCDVDTHDAAEDKKAETRDRRIRSSTWVSRHMQQKKAQMLYAEAIALARSESLKSAVAMLNARRGLFDAEETALFLSVHAHQLDKSEIGEFLATDYTRNMTPGQFVALRRAFMSLIDFTSLDLDSALRHFLVHSGFRLPGEAQKVDRLIQTFADAYVRDNPGVFPSTETVYLVAFALIMLNTDIHDPRLRAGKHARPPMTKAQFIRNVQSADANAALPTQLLSSLFDGIAAKSIEWQTAKDDSSAIVSASYQSGPTELGPPKSSTSATETHFRSECELFCRQGLAWLKSSSIRPRRFMSTDSKHIVKGMFEVIFPVLLQALTTVLEKDCDFDVEVKSACIDALKFASVIALAANAQEELEAFTGILAKITYIEQSRVTLAPAQIRKNVVAGEHMSQNWVSDFKLLVGNRSKKAVHAIIQVANRTKRHLVFERDQAVLMNIQGEFSDEVLLVDPERTFVREGHLTKLSSANKQQIYRFFLFTDLILYAREQFQKLKLHKVVHLSMCRLTDIVDRPLSADAQSQPTLRHAFKIVSPQKTFTVMAPNAQEKKAWMADIEKQIEVCYYRHKHWVEATRQLPKDHAQSLSEATTTTTKDESAAASDAPPEYSATQDSATAQNRAALMSSFLGRTKGPHGQHSPRGCRFCIRDFSLLRRKVGAGSADDGVACCPPT